MLFSYDPQMKIQRIRLVLDRRGCPTMTNLEEEHAKSAHSWLPKLNGKSKSQDWLRLQRKAARSVLE